MLDEKNPLDFYKQTKLSRLGKDAILIHTKSDLGSSSANNDNYINISVKNDTGINTLLTGLSTLLKKNLSYNYSLDPVVMSSRQKHLLTKSLEVLEDAKKLFKSHLKKKGLDTHAGLQQIDHHLKN